ncbi:hypothetical protein D3C76_415480 [compost metagenome]
MKKLFAVAALCAVSGIGGWAYVQYHHPTVSNSVGTCIKYSKRELEVMAIPAGEFSAACKEFIPTERVVLLLGQHAADMITLIATGTKDDVIRETDRLPELFFTAFPDRPLIPR